MVSANNDIEQTFLVETIPYYVFSRPEVFCKGVLKNFTKFTGKHLCQSLFSGLMPAALLKERPWHRCFPVNFATFLKTPSVAASEISDTNQLYD